MSEYEETPPEDGQDEEQEEPKNTTHTVTVLNHTTGARFSTTGTSEEECRDLVDESPQVNSWDDDDEVEVVITEGRQL